jgi:uncharacterized protein (TIGR02594 family)
VLLAPDLALAYGRATPTPNLFAAPSGTETDGGSRSASQSFGFGGDVVAEAARSIGSGKFTRLPGPWCADAVNVWLERSGHRPMEGRMASSALAYGPRLERPEVGALAVLGSRRGWAYHVGIVSGVEANGAIHLISGNWGRRVAEAVVPRGAVVAFVAVR